MRLGKIKLPAVERFACSPRQARAAFAAAALEWISFGKFIRTFSFDSRAARVPKLSGFVVASLAINRRGESHFCVYPVRRDRYPDAAADDFVASVLPRLSGWLAAMQARPATAVVGIEESVVEWTGGGHVTHTLTFL